MHQEEEEEESLLMTTICAINDEPEPAPPGGLHLDESRAQVCLGAEDEPEHVEGWFMDTGATSHMTGRRDVFSKIDRGVHGTVRFGDGSTVKIQGRGTVTFTGKNGVDIALAGVLYIPRLKNNIISVGQLDEACCRVAIEAGTLRVWDRDRRLLIKVPRGPNRLYVINFTVAAQAAAAEDTCLAVSHDHSDSTRRWHARFGHIGYDALQQLSKGAMVVGMPAIQEHTGICDTCIVTKHRRAPFPAKAKYRAGGPLDLVHGDLCGPITPATPGGRRFFLLLVDDATRYMWLAVLQAKSDAASAIKKIKAEAELEVGRPLRVLRTDNGGEFTSHEFAEYCAQSGIRRHFSAPYAPQQNGVVERRNQTIMATARALLKEMGMPARFWGEAVSTAVFLLNRAPTKALSGMTPFEAYHGRKPAVSFLRTFGCLAFVKDTKPGLKKLDDRSAPMVFIGYCDGAKAYRLYDPHSGRVATSRDVIFDESRRWNWEAKEAELTAPADFSVKFVVRREAEAAIDDDLPPVQVDDDPAEQAGGEEAGGATPQASPGAPASPEFVSPLQNDDERLDWHHNDSPVRYRRIDQLLGPGNAAPGLAERNLAELHLTAEGEPETFAEADQDAAWRKAMQEEIDAIQANNTWELSNLPAGHKAIGLKWVFKFKKNESGAVIKHKARLVAKGYVQQPGIDFDEVFAPVARMESVRLLLALAADEGWHVHHMDVKTAFLNGELGEEVYVRQPPGFIITGAEHRVFRLRRALYGLRQAPRAWNEKLDSTLRKLGFTQSEHEHAMYARSSNGGRLLVGIYVDDLVITGTSPTEIERFKTEMKNQFKMSDLGLLSFYLGIEVQQGAGGIKLCQAHYAARIVEAGGMKECNPSCTPMEERLQLSRNEEGEEEDVTLYRKLVGSLRYLVHTRPDLAFSVGYISRFMQRPTAEHWAALKRVLRYVAGTLDYGCFYQHGSGGAKLVGYSDSDFAGDVDNSHSTSGVLYFLGKSLVSWQSLKQRVVAMSSCEAEYIAATSAATQGVWLAWLLADLKMEESKSVELRVDNKSALALMKNPVFHDRSKHIKVKYHYVRQCVGDGSIVVKFVGTNDQLADIGTKALGRVKHQELRTRLGMVQVKSKLTHKT